MKFPLRRTTSENQAHRCTLFLTNAVRATLISALCVVGVACKKSGPAHAALIVDQHLTEGYAREVCEHSNNWIKIREPLIKQLGCDAVTACKEMMPKVEACAGVDHGSGDAREFENDFNAFVLADPQCKGVQVFNYGGPDEKPVRRMPDSAWWLSFDYVPGDSAQAWALNHSPDELHNDFYGNSTGHGSAKAAADLVCGIVGARGAAPAD